MVTDNWKIPSESHDFPLSILCTVNPQWNEVKVAQSCLTLCDPMDYTAHGILQARILEWVAFPFSRGSSQPRDWTQVSRIAGGFFYQLSHSGSPRILEWVAYPFSRGSSRPRNWTQVSCIAGGFFTNWAIREAQILNRCFLNTTTKYLIGKLLPFWKNQLEERCSWGFRSTTENRISAGKKTCLLRCIVNDGWEIPLLLRDSCT